MKHIATRILIGILIVAATGWMLYSFESVRYQYLIVLGLAPFVAGIFWLVRKQLVFAVLVSSFSLSLASWAREPEIRRAIPVTDEPEVRRAIAVNVPAYQFTDEELKAAEEAGIVLAQATTLDPDPLVIDEPTPSPTPTVTSPNYSSEEGNTDDATSFGRFLLFVLLAILFGAMYLWLLPGIIASKRKHPNAESIWLITIFLGWSVFGWIGALVWSCSSKD
jgi:hypothetical protein